MIKYDTDVVFSITDYIHINTVPYKTLPGWGRPFVGVEAVGPVFQMKMLGMRKNTGWPVGGRSGLPAVYPFHETR